MYSLLPGDKKTESFNYQILCRKFILNATTEETLDDFCTMV